MYGKIKIIVQFIITVFSTNNAFGQSYSLFNNSRITTLLDACSISPPNGQSYVMPHNLSVATNNNGITVFDHSNRSPRTYYYSLEKMLLGIGESGKIFGDPLFNFSSVCYSDYLYYFSAVPTFLDVELTTQETVNNGDNSTGSEVTLSATPGYHPLVYTWQYYVDFTRDESLLFPENTERAIKNEDSSGHAYSGRGDFSFSSNWRNFPSQFLGKDTITFIAEDLFGEYADQFVGRSIKFRIRMSNGWISDKIFSFVFIPSSPKLKKVVEDNATCNYSKDGTFRLELNRDLADDEYLTVSLFFKDETNLEEGYSLFKQQDTSMLVKIDNNYTYTWNYSQDPLPPQTYKIKYQTYNGAEGIPDESSWASLKFSNEFTIQKATNVDFIAKWVNDESCFEAGDGKIQVEVTSGETGRSYFYIVYKIEETTETLERGWTSFLGSTTVISGLGKGKYKIKVKDSQDCLAK